MIRKASRTSPLSKQHRDALSAILNIRTRWSASLVRCEVASCAASSMKNAYVRRRTPKRRRSGFEVLRSSSSTSRMIFVAAFHKELPRMSNSEQLRANDTEPWDGKGWSTKVFSSAMVFVEMETRSFSFCEVFSAKSLWCQWHSWSNRSMAYLPSICCTRLSARSFLMGFSGAIELICIC